MKNIEILKTENKDWGFWGTSDRNGYDAELAWNAASRFLMAEFELTAEQARDVLDARFGRHLADDLSFIENGKGEAKGPISTAAINKHLTLRVADRGWRDCFENAIREVTGKTFPRKAPKNKDEVFTLIAQQHLGIETLVERKSDSLDFHDVAVWSVKDALEAAFEAGRKAREIKETAMNDTVRVIYARKPADWHEIESCSRYGSGTAYKTEIIETREMTAVEYDEFIDRPLKSRDWMDGKGGWKNNDTRLAIAVTSPGRETLYVDPSGSNYGRYVGRRVADPSAVKFPEVRVRLVGQDGNAFNVLGLCKRAAYRAGVSDLEIAAFLDEATNDDYNHLLATCQRWFDCY